MLFKFLLLSAFTLSPFGFAKAFTWALDSLGEKEFELELDPYYTAADYIFSITDQPIPKIDPNQEQGLYSYLFFNMGHPRFGLFEVSVNPLPLLGTSFAERKPEAYRKADINGNQQLNAISLLTTGFPEPWAMSYFLGNVVDMVSGDSIQKSVGKGYGGAVLSLGNYHIVNNMFVKDYWAEGEIKLKGSANMRDRKMSWSFRIGGKLHSHTDIYNVMYFSVKRDRVDLREPLTWNLKNLILRNSEVEVRADTRIPREWELWEYLSKVMILGGKKWPSKSGEYAFSLSAGVLLQLSNGYRGQLAEELPDRLWGVMLRPNIVF